MNNDFTEQVEQSQLEEDIQIDKINQQVFADVEDMTDLQISRWAALVEAINLISEKAKNKNILFKKIALKQNAIQKYVDSASDIICYHLN